MPRSLWNGTISFGLIHVPVKLYTAMESKTVSFREVHLEDEGEDRAPALLLGGGQEVPYEEVVRGFEVSEGEYVVLEKDEVAAAAGDRGNVVDVEAFVPRRLDRPGLLREDVPPRAGRQGRGRLPAPARRAGADRPGRPRPLHVPQPRVPRGDPRARRRARAAHDALRRRAREGLDIKVKRPSRAPAKQEIEMAAKLVAPCTSRSTPEKRKDKYRKAVLDMIERKAAGKKPQQAAREAARGDARPDGRARGEPGRCRARSGPARSASGS